MVADKVAEADYFLDQLHLTQGFHHEFGFIFSAFVTAARSVTFVLQSVMSHYPGFDEWYEPERAKLEQNELAKFFVKLRNHAQKVGGIPISHTGFVSGGSLNMSQTFVPLPTSELQKVPQGEVIDLCEFYFRDLLALVGRCYREFAVYADPRSIFTKEGLAKLGWNIEDVEEALGFPRGWTKVEDSKDCDDQRLILLSRYGGDELIEKFLEKHRIKV